MCLRDGGTGWFVKGNYSAQCRWCKGLPTWTQVSVGREKEWGWFYFWQRAASPCLLPETTCGRSEGALFCLVLLGNCILWKSYLLVDVDIGIMLLNAMSYVFCLKEQTTTAAALLSKNEGV